MASALQTAGWDKLAPPPRQVPPSVQARVRWNELKNGINFGNGFLGLWFLAAGLMLIICGTAWHFGAEQADHPEVGIPLAVVGVALVAVQATLLYRQGSRHIRLLGHGIVMPGTVTHVRHNLAYRSYASILAEMQQFVGKAREMRESNPFMGALVERGMQQYGQMPCKVRVVDKSGAPRDVNVRLHLCELVERTGAEPRVEVLCDPAVGNDGLITNEFYEFYRELALSPDGEWTVKESAGFSVLATAFLRSAVPVVGTYLSAALGIMLFGISIPKMDRPEMSSLVAMGLVLLLTVSHAVGPVFFFAYVRRLLDQFSKALQSVEGGIAGHVMRWQIALMRAFHWVFVAVWFGAPIIVLAWLTGWLSLAWAAVHVALAKRGTRVWEFLEYGSTSVSLLALIACFAPENFFPFGLFVVVLQALLLTVLDVLARDKWIAQIEDPKGTASEPGKT